MADLTITAANITPGAGAKTGTGIAGGTITAGEAVYKDTTVTPNQIKAAAHTSAVLASAVGIALNGATTGQPVTYINGGQLNMGTILTKGTAYVVGAAAGGIAPDADLSSGWFRTDLGVAISTAILAVNVVPSGISL